MKIRAFLVAFFLAIPGLAFGQSCIDPAWNGSAANTSNCAVLKAIYGLAASPPSSTVNQGTGGVSAWLVKLDQTGSNNNVVVSSSALPTGAATAANQATANASLSSIDTKLTAPLSVSLTGSTATTTSAGATITTGGVAQTALASSGSRKGCLIVNDIAASETLYVRFNGTASAGGDSIGLAAGAAISCAAGNYVLTDAVSVFAATTGHKFQVNSQ